MGGATVEKNRKQLLHLSKIIELNLVGAPLRAPWARLSSCWLGCKLRGMSRGNYRQPSRCARCRDTLLMVDI